MNQKAFDLLHSSKGSSELSPQSSSMSHFQLWGMQRPLRHLNCPGRQVLAAHCAGSSSDWSLQSTSPSHCHDSGMQRLLAHCHWWASHWCVAEGGLGRRRGRSALCQRKFLNLENKFKLDIFHLSQSANHRELDPRLSHPGSRGCCRTGVGKWCSFHRCTETGRACSSEVGRWAARLSRLCSPSGRHISTIFECTCGATEPCLPLSHVQKSPHSRLGTEQSMFQD